MVGSRSGDGDGTGTAVSTVYQQFIFQRYAKWLPQAGRRETWPEAVARYFDFMKGHIRREHPRGAKYFERDVVPAAERAVLDLEVMPSMRALMTAGPALERDNTAAYNCAAVLLDSVESMAEMMYLLMCGSGVGFSVESEFVRRLPVVPDVLHTAGDISEPRNSPARLARPLVVADSREGWVDAFRALFNSIYHDGIVLSWDLSLVRPAGRRLRTFGGRASGPAPLDSLLDFVVRTARGATGRRLRPIEVHDVACKIAECVVAGGVRRSACLSLSDLDDRDMRLCKFGAEWNDAHPHRNRANNSVALNSRPSREAFDAEWASLRASRSGERGIFSRVGARAKIAAQGRRDPAAVYLLNPCGETLLVPNSFCNLTEVVARAHDTESTLVDKVSVAAALGTVQATLSLFPALRPVWTENARRERLLGVSITGIQDCPLLNGTPPGGIEATCDLLGRLRGVATRVNAALSERLGVAPAAAITLVKPSGTVSQLVDSSSGIHPRHSACYVRTAVCSDRDPVARVLREAGVPNEPSRGTPGATAFMFPVRSPPGAVTRDDLSAVDQLRLSLAYSRHWCDHNVSCTVTVREHEWDEARDFVWDNLDDISGVSFFPRDDHIYDQAPYRECSEEECAALEARMPANVDWDRLAAYEREQDHDEEADDERRMRLVACAGNACELADRV